MSAYEVGDRVRVTYEGVVTGEDMVANRVHLDGGPSYVSIGAALPLRAADMTVTVLERRKPKVGDVITADEVAGFDAPSGTVIYNRYGDHWMRGGLGHWVCYTGAAVKSHVFTGRSPYTVAYIPD